MMKTQLLLILALVAPSFAQTTVKDALVKHWKVSTDFTLAVAKTMPAEDYSFKPVPEEMSFGHLMLHLSAANQGACALASGAKRPDIPDNIMQGIRGKAELDKDTVLKFVTETSDFCNQAVAGLTPEKLDAIVGPGNRKMAGFEWVWAYFTHMAHHRGQAEVYMRLKGVKPPDYEF